MAYSPTRHGAPYRAPAGGWSGMNLDYVRTPVTRTITHRTNTTTVPDPANPSHHIPPFTRSDDGSGIAWPTCSGGCGCVNTSGQPRQCGPWLVEEIVAACYSSTNNHNSFGDPTTTQTQISCHGGYGWKGVQAVKVWHGRLGFLSADDSAHSDDYLVFDRTAAHLTPDGTKYCGLSFSSGFHQESYNCGSELSMATTGSFSYSASVNKLSGILTRGGVSKTGSVTVPADSGIEDCSSDPDAASNPLCKQYYEAIAANSAAGVGAGWASLSGTTIMSSLLMPLNDSGGTHGFAGSEIGLVCDETGISPVGGGLTWSKTSGDACSGSWTATDGDGLDAGSLSYSNGVLSLTTIETVGYDGDTEHPIRATTLQVDCTWGSSLQIQRWQRWADFYRDNTNGDNACTMTPHSLSLRRSYNEVLTLTNTSIVYTKDTTSALDSGANIINSHWECTITLDAAYTSSELNNTLDSLLGYWSLAADEKLPWRTDAYTTICPLVMYNEVHTVVSPADVDLTGDAYTDPNAAKYDGAILGAPSADYPNFFWQYEDWDYCDDESSNHHWWIRAWGQWSNANVVSPYATAWTNNGPNFPWGAQSLPTGAFFIGSAGIYAKKKWAETKLPTPSFNFGRPWGDDRLLVDETNLACVDSYQQIDDDKVLTVGGIPSGITASTPVAIVGVDGVDIGSYTVTPYSGSTPQLKITSGPLQYPVDSDQYGRAYVAPIRFPNCPAIQGRVNVVGVAQGDDVIIISVDRAIYLFTSGTENVQIAGITGIASGSYAATRLTSTSFSIPGTLSTAWQSGGYVTSPGAASYAWDDNGVKGDAVLLDYGFNHRDVGEHDRLAGQGACGLLCNPPGSAPRSAQATHGMPSIVSSMTITPVGLISTPCGPKVMAYTPNAETWGGGVVRGIPQISSDEKYGIRWQGIVLQWMDDPLWQAPANCGECTLEEDGGGCSLDTCAAGSGSVYYPHRPVFEAMADIPDGAPTTLRDHIHILGLSAIAAGTDGVVLTPPEAVGIGMAVAVPASVYASAQGCVCANGRFKSIYTTQFTALCGS